MLSEGLTQRTSRLGTIYYENIDGVILGKRCGVCNHDKKLEDFSKDKKGLGKTVSTCKECRAKHARVKRGYSAEGYGTRVTLEVREGVTGKPCTNCRTWKELADYSEHSIGLGGRESNCRECRAVYYYENQEIFTARGREYHKNNPEKSVLKSHRRRARMVLLPQDFTSDQMQTTLDYFGGCVLTGGPSNIHWDHAIPIATGWGGTTFGNMIPLRSDLNLSKNDENIFEWFIRTKDRLNLSQAKFDRLIEWLAKTNDMTPEEYQSFVYSCFENKRNVHSDDTQMA